MPTDYQSNSDKNKREKVKPEGEEKTIEKVISGEVIKRKPPLGQRFKTIFFGGDAKGASRYIVGDVLLPALRNLVVDMTSKGIERMVYGDRGPRRPSGFDYRPRIQYHSPIMRQDPRMPGRLPDQSPRSTRRESAELVLSTRDEAELVLERLMDILEKYESVSVADLYDLCGLPSSHVDHKWGWFNLNTTEVRQVRDGFLLDLPPAEEV